MSLRTIFDIESITPTGENDLWSAQVAVRIQDEVNGQTILHLVQVKVVVSQKINEPIEGLLQKVYSRVRSTLEGACAVVENNTIQDFLRDQTSHRKPLE